MCRSIAAFVTACLFVVPGCVSAAQRAGLTAKSPSPASRACRTVFPRALRLAAQKTRGSRHGFGASR